MKKTLWAALAAVLLSACGSDNDSEGAISLAVTDAPVDNAEAVVVTFTGIELLGADGGVRERFTFDTPQTVDLLQLQGDNSHFLIRNAVVPVGVYQEVRLFVDADNASCSNPSGTPASYIRIDGVDYPLVVPSGGSSGFKVKGPLTVAAGGTAAYTVDFDLRQSIAERGATQCYNLRPVLRVVDNAQVGTLAGTVSDTLLADTACTADPTTGEGAAVYVYEGAGVTPDDVDGTEPEPLTSGLVRRVDGLLRYEVGFLLAGDYTIAFTCQAADDAAETDDSIVFGPVADVTITADAVTTHDFVPAAP